MSAQVLPKQLRLNAPPTMPQARSYLFKQPSVEQTVSFGSTVTINIPRLQRSYLTKDSYLRFDLHTVHTQQTTVGAGTADSYLCWDTPGALGAIDKIEVFDYLGSTLLESTSGHGQLMALLMDITGSKSEFGNHFNTICGTSQGPTTRFRNEPYLNDRADSSVPTDTRAVSTPAWENNLSFAMVGSHDAPVSGEIICNRITTQTQPQINHRQYAIPLFSFLGLLSNKFVPLHNGFTIVLTLNSLANAFGSVVTATDQITPTNYNAKTGPVAQTGVPGTTINPGLASSTLSQPTYIDNVYFCAQVLELGPVAESMLLDSTQGSPLVVPAKAYRNYIGSVPDGSSNFRLDLNLNVASLTNILWIMRDSSKLNSLFYRCLSSRVRNFLQNWWFQYGSSVLPQTSGINAMSPMGQLTSGGGYTEAYVELLKSRHAWNIEHSTTQINAENFTIDETVWQDDLFSIRNDPQSTVPGNSIEVSSRLPLADANGVGTRGPYCPILSPFNTSPVGKFACGLDLELVSGKSQEIVCGMNTNGMNTSIYGNFYPTYSQSLGTSVTPHVRQCRVDAWAEYDAFINISPSIATTVSF